MPFESWRTELPGVRICCESPVGAAPYFPGIQHRRELLEAGAPEVPSGGSPNKLLTWETIAAPIMSARFGENLRSKMRAYLNYRRDDPKFDTAITDAATSHLPCPVLDEAALMRMSKFAIDNSFGKARRRVAVLEFETPRRVAGGDAA
jgi:hypothetical protein